MANMTGKVVLVTGAGKPDGIGRACAQKICEAGGKVLVCDLESTPGFSSVVEELGCPGDQTAIFPLDVTDPVAAKGAVAFAVERFGRLDGLVNNAGVGVGAPDFTQLSRSDWDLSLGVNLMGVVHLCQAVVPIMRDQKYGAIVNIASLSGLGAIPAIPACYTASKFATVGLTKQLALELAADGVRVNAVCPGSVRTSMMADAMAMLAEQEGISVEQAEKLESQGIAMGRPATPSEVAASVLYLLSEDASYLTGTAIPIAGGMMPGI